jgi:hypothetical protein
MQRLFGHKRKRADEDHEEKDKKKLANNEELGLGLKVLYQPLTIQRPLSIKTAYFYYLTLNIPLSYANLVITVASFWPMA